MNTEQIIKALECCSNNDECVGEACPYFTAGCEKNMPKDALALIKEQQAQIENLKNENKYLRERLAEEAEIKEDMKAEGEWETISDYQPNRIITHTHICSICKTSYKDIRPRGHRYCHNCGAKMKGE